MAGDNPHNMRDGHEFPVTDDALEIMGDAALGPEPAEDDGDDPLRLPSDLTAAEVHRQSIRDRLRGARLLAMPDVRDVLSARRKKRFLVALAETGIISKACARAGWTRNTAYSLRNADKDFADRWDDALEFAADTAEEAAFNRGVYGVERDVYFKGEAVGKEVVYSDRLLELTLKARRPDKFRDSHKVEAHHTGGVLVVPQAPSEGDWEGQSAAGQAKFREAPDPI
jgi:hypothetical protein